MLKYSAPGDRDERGDQQHGESLPAHVGPVGAAGEATVRRRRRIHKITKPAIATRSGAMAMLMIFKPAHPID